MSNHINDIEITNFKSIRHQKIDGCRRINLFIGYPNVGKSNILEAIGTNSYFFNDQNNTSLKNIIRFENTSDIFFEGDLSLEPHIEIDGYLSIITNESGVINIDLYDAAIKLQDKLTIKRIFFSEEEEFIPDTSNSANFAKLSNLAIEFPNIKRYHYKISTEGLNNNSPILSTPFGNNLMETLSHNKILRKSVSELFEIYNLKLALDKSSQSLKIIRNNDDDSILILPYSLIADTLQRLIFYKAAIASNKDTVLLFEEPEAHMFPPYIRKFTADVMFDKTNQFFIATHSPYVLEAFLEEVPDDLSIYLVDYKNGETIIKRLEDKDLEEVRNYGVDLFFNLESYLNDGQVNNA